MIIKHCYAERRVIPLDLYVRQADPLAARTAVIDYGQAIKDLAITNLFPGDLLLKNFGVTRQNRVVFYDYDEVRLLTACRFSNFRNQTTSPGRPPTNLGSASARKTCFPKSLSTFSV